MTTMFSKWGFQTSSRIVLFFGMLLLGSGAFAQLDSVSVILTFDNEILTDSIGAPDTVGFMTVKVYTDDVDFLGEIIVTVYDVSSNFPLGKLKYTKQEAVNEGILSGSETSIRFDNKNASSSYRVEALVRNYQGANHPLVTVNHN